MTRSSLTTTRSCGGHPARGRRLRRTFGKLLATTALILLLSPAVALAWEQKYSENEARYPGSIRYSGANYSLNYTITTFVRRTLAQVT
jgi:hypothetical protein